MPEIFRSRDCVVWFKDDSFTVTVAQAMVSGGWPGGQGVQWVGSTADEFIVSYARGRYAGFLVWGSDEEGDDFASMTRNQPHYRFATMLFGAALMGTTSYERYTYASRLAGPLVPLVYTPNQELFLSLRGLWTPEDELTLSGDPEAPAQVAGYVAQLPKSTNSLFLGIQTAM
jgi:hypothetical protein